MTYQWDAIIIVATKCLIWYSHIRVYFFLIFFDDHIKVSFKASDYDKIFNKCWHKIGKTSISSRIEIAIWKCLIFKMIHIKFISTYDVNWMKRVIYVLTVRKNSNKFHGSALTSKLEEKEFKKISTVIFTCVGLTFH